MKIRSVAIAVASMLSQAVVAAEPVWQDNWPRFQAEEVGITGSLIGTTILFTALSPDPMERWRGPILLDKPVRNLLHVRKTPARNTADTVSDVMLWSLVAWPLTDGAVAAVQPNGLDAGGQMALISLQSLTISTFGKQVVSDFAGRRRPYGDGCDDDPDYIHNCGTPDINRSFYSGHTALAVTGAALVCVQHTNVEIYGGAADQVACVTAAVAAGTVGALRIVADRHYFSDVFVGGALGLGSGLLLPRLMHYRSGPAPTSGSAPTVRIRIPL